MFRRLVLLLLSTFLGFAFAGSTSALALESPAYVPRAKGPLEVAGTPTSVIYGINGSGVQDLHVVSGPEGIFERFKNDGFGRLSLSSSLKIPGGSLWSDGIGTFGDYDRPIHAFVQPDQGTITLTKFNEATGKDSVTMKSRIGTRPSSATVVGSLFRSLMPTLAPIDAAVTDESENTFSMVNASAVAGAFPVLSTTVGSRPVAADSFNEFIWFVANKGSNDVSVVNLLAGDAHPTPSLDVAQTIPVGNIPVDVLNIDPRGPGQMIAVVTQGSDSVSILARDGDGNDAQMREVQRISVGGQPTSVTSLRVNGDSLPDLAVTNSGSNDVSLLINDGNEQFSHGQRIKVGERPVDSTALSLNRYFADDLAVANAGDGTVSLLLKQPIGSGECFGRPANTIQGTDQADVLGGTRDPDFTSGESGDDSIRGSTGYDCLFGGPGKDDIFGGFNGDKVIGGAGDDRLSGFNGNDLIRGGDGDDYICDSDDHYNSCYSRSESFRDYLPDQDRIFGGRGADRIEVGPKEDRVNAGPGDDAVYAMDGARDLIDCGPGRDFASVDIKDVTTNCERIEKRDPV